MDSTSSSDISQFSGFSADDIPLEYQDPNNGLLYNAVETCLGETITFTFHSKKEFDQVIRRLSNLYAFTPNQAQSGQSATTSLGNVKIVITAYNSCKLMVQGKESRLWRNTVLKAITESLTKEASNPRRSPAQSTFPQLMKPKSKSTSVLSSVTKALFGPPIDKDLVKLGKQLKKAQKSAKRGGPEVDYNYFSHQLQLAQKTCPGVDELEKSKISTETEGKPEKSHKGYRPVNWQFRESMTNKTTSRMSGPRKVRSHSVGGNTLNCTRILSNSMLPDEEETLLKSVHEDENKSKSASVPDITVEYEKDLSDSSSSLESPHETNNDLQYTPEEPPTATLIQIQIMQAEITNLTTEKTNLQMKYRNQSKELEKHKREIDRLKSELTNVNEAVGRQRQDNKVLEQEVSSAAQKIASLTSKALIIEEENTKLVQTNKKLITENKKIQSSMNKQTTATDNHENILSVVTNLTEEMEKIQTTLNEVQNKVKNSASEADIVLLKADLKNTLNQEIGKLKPSEPTGICSNHPIVVEDQSPQPQQSAAPNSKETAATYRPGGRNNAETKKSKHVYILGDTVTKVLNPKRMSGDQYSVSIKTCPGARISQVKSTVQTLSTKDTRLATCDAVVLHVGIHNISDAQSTQSITEEYKSLISTIKKVNTKACIIVSSVLPKKEDRLSLTSIRDVNEQLKVMCDQDSGIHFIDNTQQANANHLNRKNSDNFIVEGSVNKALYIDEVRLSSKGAGVLARNIMDTLNQCLKTGYNSRSERAGNFHRTSLQRTMAQHHQPWGARRPQPQRRIPVPPWLMTQYWGQPPHYY